MSALNALAVACAVVRSEHAPDELVALADREGEPLVVPDGWLTWARMIGPECFGVRLEASAVYESIVVLA